MKNTAVIVPFYQKEKGILIRAVFSALQQTAINHINKIIVINDGSPIDATNELQPLSTNPLYNKILLIRQHNSGPGAARNTGLNNLPADTKYVAFLDSDDEWSAHHIERGLKALDYGCDFYFADWQRPDSETTFLASNWIVNKHNHLPIGGEHLLFHYNGDAFRDMLETDIAGTSTVMYRREKFPNLRFCEQLYLGEDVVFWLDMLMHSDKVIFSRELEAKYGRGINIWAGPKWGDVTMIDHVFNEIKVTRTILQRYNLSVEAQKRLKTRLAQDRVELIKNILHCLKQRKMPEFTWFVKKIMLDPFFWMFVPVVMMRLLLLKLLSKTNEEKKIPRRS